ncbi:MAG: hypothetical protein WBC05_09555, partial [Sedimentisphaerales bacterium]
PIIGRTCAFDAKIYKNVDAIFAVSPCVVWNKKYFQISDFCFQLPSLLVEKFRKNSQLNRHRFWSKNCGYFAHFNTQNALFNLHPEIIDIINLNLCYYET